MKGDKYEGQWNNGLKQGYGIYIHTNGKIEEGLWKGGDFVKAQKIPIIENKDTTTSKKIDTHNEYLGKRITCYSSHKKNKGFNNKYKWFNLTLPRKDTPWNELKNFNYMESLTGKGHIIFPSG